MKSARRSRLSLHCAVVLVGCSLLAAVPGGAAAAQPSDVDVTTESDSTGTDSTGTDSTGTDSTATDLALAELADTDPVNPDLTTDGDDEALTDPDLAPEALPEEVAPPAQPQSQEESAAEAQAEPTGDGAIAAAPAPAPVAATRTQFVQSFLNYSIGKLATKTGDADPTYFLGGRWVAADNNCLRCQVGPGVAAAALYATNGNGQALQLAISTFDTVVAENVFPDGSFGPAGWGEVNRDIQTTLTANELGTAYLLLEDALSPGQRASWSAAVTRAADFLVVNGNLAWYTNGNIVLANVLTMALAYRISGNPLYQAYYEQALSFAVAPRQDRWPGYGWITTRLGQRADGADSAGYLTEAAARGIPGFDAEYTSLSLNVATRLFVVTGDERALRMMHGMINQLWFRIDLNTWLLDTSNGTRHPEPVRSVNFDSGALEVLSILGGRSYFWDYFGVERLRKLDWVARTDAPCAGPGTYFSYGDGPVSVLIALNPALVNRFRSISVVTPVVKDRGPADGTVSWNQFPVLPRTDCAG